MLVVCFAGWRESLRHEVWSIDGIAFPRLVLRVEYALQRRKTFCDVSELEYHTTCADTYLKPS
jgi:hypothetical protein